MSDALDVMFTADGVPTPTLQARWKAKGGTFSLQAGVAYLEGRTATTALRSLWRVSFPAKRSLPLGPIVTADGRFNDEMLNLWL